MLRWLLRIIDSLLNIGPWRSNLWVILRVLLRSLVRTIGMDNILNSSLFGPEFKMVFVVNMELDMGRGKQCAQVAHAALGLYLDISQSNDDEVIARMYQWLTSGAKKVVLRGQNLAEMKRIQQEAVANKLPTHLVADAGHTQISPGSKTVLGIFGTSQELDKITGSLRLL